MNRRRAISRPASLRPVWSEDGSALYFLIGGDLKCVPMADGIPGQVEIVGSALKFGMNVIEDGTLYDIDKDERVVMIRGGGIEDLISGFGAIVNVGTLLRELDPER